MTPWARITAALIAAIAWTGLAVQFAATFADNHSIAVTLGTLLWFFTITTNLLVAVVFTAIAASKAVAPGVVGGTTLSILLVGVIYGLLLRGLQELSGGSLLANTLLHVVTPILVPLFWLAFVGKGRLTRRDPLQWAIYPLAYLIYILARGAVTGRYPYPFINVTQLGWPRTALNAILISAGFLLAGYALVALDARLPRPTSKTDALPERN